ncbi:hypothetical protein R1flu_015574 [Riccia fluitans]|uniref:Uncharacterized protein n=1 Tax=Riccia fluitans TaxID=41844 RepID=A0ABD1YJB7_9MARC
MMADEAVGQRLPTIRLMDEELYTASTTEQIQKFRSRIQFVPYSFKEMKDLDLGLQNTDAEGDRLLVKDARGGTNVIGWNEIAVIFGAKHNDSEDFRSIKVMHTTLDKYNLLAYLPASVEHNPNKKLVSGQPYEEVLYYKDAALYGSTYCLVTTMAELFWSPLEEAEGWIGWTHVTKDTDMTLPQLHSKFPKLITSLSHMRQRCQLPKEIPIASPEQAVSTRRPHAEDKQPEEFVPTSLE